MKCPYLEILIFPTCFAMEKAHQPNPVQLAEYCHSRHYRECPYFEMSKMMRLESNEEER
jgi:hypothetical protein